MGTSNDYNQEQLNMNFTVHGLLSIFATGGPSLIAVIGNAGEGAGKINSYINEGKGAY